MTRKKIKSVSLKLFANNGYDGTSLESIAKEVGIRKSSIYSHFKTKEELFLITFEDALNSDIEDLKELVNSFNGYSTKDKLHNIFKHYCEKSENDEIVFMKRIMLFPPEILKEKLQCMFKEYESCSNELLISILEEGLTTKAIKLYDIKDLLAIFYCLIDGIFLETHYYARKEYVSRFDSIWKLFWSAIENTDLGKDE